MSKSINQPSNALVHYSVTAYEPGRSDAVSAAHMLSPGPRSSMMIVDESLGTINFWIGPLTYY